MSSESQINKCGDCPVDDSHIFYGLGQGCLLADDYEFGKASNEIRQYVDGNLSTEKKRDLK